MSEQSQRLRRVGLTSAQPDLLSRRNGIGSMGAGDAVGVLPAMYAHLSGIDTHERSDKSPSARGKG
jgi:hypothetical protein